MSKNDRDRWNVRHGSRGHGGASDRPAPFFVEHASLLAPGRTLDVAAGRGRNALFLAANGHRVIAADVAREALAEIRTPSIQPVCMDLDDPGFRGGAFDNVVCVNFLDRRLFPEFARWLRPGGALLVDTFLIDQKDVGHPRNPDFLLRRNELRSLLTDGWRVLELREGRVEEDGAISFHASAVAVRAG